VAPAELPDLRDRGELIIAEDIETRDDSLAAGRGSGWPYRSGHIAGIAWAWDDQAIYVPLRHPEGANFDEGAVRRWLGDHHAAAGGLRWLYHSANYDLGWQRAQWGLEPPSIIEDSLAAAVMVDENRLNYQLDDLCRWRDLPGKDERALREAAAAYGYHGDAVKGALWRLPARYVGLYAEADARATLALYNALVPTLEAEGTWAAYRLEMDLVPMCLEMRRRGIRVDLEGVARSRGALLEKRDGVLKELTEQLGVTALGMEQVRSPRWLEKAHDSQRIGYPRTAKTGQGSFTKDWMRGHEHWLPRLVSRADQLTEAADKFLKGFILDYAHRGRLHASVNSYRGEPGDGTRSYRFSYSDPALQQAPSRDEEIAAVFRGAFLPEPGEVWGSFDWSQQEYRLIVHFAELLDLPGAGAAAQRYREDPETDFHQYVAEITGLDRKPAKDANFGVSYGAGVKKFAMMIGQSEEAARAILDQYNRELPFVKELAKRCQQLAESRGWVRLLNGARSHFDLWELAWRDGEPGYAYPRPLAAARALWPDKRLRRAFCQKALNRLIQGSAAIQAKLALRQCWHEGITPLLMMHDEIDVSVGDEKTALRVAEIMRDVVQLRVPMKVDAEFGKDWGSAKNAWNTA
jgi:DNA polymerase I-like protein with 3'-5' exonuclease and polymerase domains